MKTLYLLLIALLPVISNAQAHLGSTLTEIKEMYPGKRFNIDYADNGTKYASASMPLGTFVYYFEKESGNSRFCLQIPDDMKALNAQVEIYNNKYVIESETSWKAYLDGGGIMRINLSYNKDYKTYLFMYTQMETSTKPSLSQKEIKISAL